MKSLPAITIAIYAASMMSSMVHAQVVDAAKVTPAVKTLATKEAEIREQKELEGNILIIVTRANSDKKTPEDEAFATWLNGVKEKHAKHVPWKDAKFRKELRKRLADHGPITVELPKRYDAPAATGPSPQELSEAIARAESSEAAFKKCTADCAAVREEAERLRAENAAIKAKAEEDARRLAAAEEEARRAHGSSYKDHDHTPLDEGTDHRRSSKSNSRLHGRTTNEILANLFGNGNQNGMNQFGNDPFSLNNQNLFGANGMQNPYNNWMQQQRMAQMYQQQMMYQQQQQRMMAGQYGLNGGRQLPNMYQAPGGANYAYNQPISQWGQRPGYGAYPMGQTIYNQGFGAGVLGGGYGARPGAPPVLPYAGGAYNLGANVGGLNTPIYNSGYTQYAQYNQYSQRQLPTAYPAPR